MWRNVKLWLGAERRRPTVTAMIKRFQIRNGGRFMIGVLALAGGAAPVSVAQTRPRETRNTPAPSGNRVTARSGTSFQHSGNTPPSGDCCNLRELCEAMECTFSTFNAASSLWSGILSNDFALAY